MALCIVAISFAGGGIVLGLGALGIGLSTAFAWPIWAGLVIASALGLIVATVGFLIAAGAIKRTVSVFKRSRDEFTRNVETFKLTLNGNGNAEADWSKAN